MELIGYLGSGGLLIGYILLLKGYWSSKNKYYLLTNFISGLLLTFYTIYHHAYPAAVLNLVFAFATILIPNYGDK
jgi:hypothetical protein